MKKTKTVISLLLVLAMVLALTACGQDSTGATTGAATVLAQTTSPTQAGPDCKTLYADAKADAMAMEDVKLKVTTTEKRTVGSDTFVNTSSQTILCHGLNTDHLVVKIEEDAEYSLKRVTAQYYYQDGKGYTTCAGGSFVSPLDQEGFLELFSPVALLDENLYSSVTSEPLKKGQKLTFTGADVIEDWIGADERFIPQELGGTAVLNEDGSLKETSYSMIYTIGGVSTDFSSTVKVQALEKEEIPDLTSMLARLNSEALEIPTLILPALIEQAKGSLEASQALSAQMQHISVSAAGNLTSTLMTGLETWGKGNDFSCKISSNNTLADFEGNSDNAIFDETYIDGLYTFTMKGGEPETDPNVDADALQYAISKDLTYYIAPLANIKSMTAKATNTNLLISYDMNEERGEFLSESVSSSLFDDPDLLNNAASDYRTDSVSGYLSLDLITGLPVAISSAYTGTHTIDGTEYTLADTVNQTIHLGSNSAYEAIHGEPLPEAEPEQTATPLLYHVTNEDGQEMWLFGTIHVGDSRTAYLPQTVYDAFDAADALAVEFDIQELDEAVMEDPALAMKILQSFYFTDGSTLSSHLEPELYAAAVTALKATGNYDITGSAEVLRPAIASTMLDNYITSQSYSLYPEKGADNRLLTRAKAQGKKIMDVESAEAQLGMMADFSDELQALLLTEALHADPIQACRDLTELYELWCRGDEAALSKFLKEDTAPSEEMTEEEKALVEEYWNALGTNRNDDMLEVAKAYLASDETVFYAVGLAHLLAEDGLVNTLRAAGYTVELVKAN